MRHFEIIYKHPRHKRPQTFETCRHVFAPSVKALEIEAERHALGVQTIGRQKPLATILQRVEV